MQRKMILLVILGFLFFALLGCDKISLPGFKKAAPKEKTETAPTIKGTLVAKVNNIPVTLESLNEEIETLNALVPADKPEAKIDTKEEKINYLKNEMVRRALLYQEALDRRLESKEDVQRVLEKTKQDLLVIELIREEAGKVDVTSAEIEDYYNQYKEQLREPEERGIREIMVPTEVEARDILIELLRGGDFATLAKERSKAASASNGGDLGFIAVGSKFEQFDSVAFAESLEVGKFSNIFKGPDGYYIIQLEGKRGGKLKSLSEMWDDIKRGLIFLKQQSRIQELISNLSQRAKIEIYEGEIK